jgi:hypothetical protein
VGVPVGGTAGQFLTKIDGTNYNTDWTTVNLSVYAVKANNLSDLPSAPTARTNLGLGSLAVVNDAPSDGSQYARKNAAWEVVTTTPDFISSVSSPLSVTSGNLTIDLSAYAPLASPAFTGNPTAPTAALGDNDTSLATTAFVQQELASGVAVAKNLEVYVRNQSGSTIPAGSIVYISGATGSKPLITLAQANNDANSAQTIGFTKTSIANNGFGYVIVRGELENIDTSALTEGVQLYLSPTVAGSWTTTKPSAPQHLVYVGIVIRSHPTLGTILVAVQNGYELDELHDVAIGTLANNDLLAYESSTDLWKNKTYSALGLLTSADAASTYAPLASPALTGNVTITSNSTGAALFIEQSGTGNILTLHDQASDTNFVAIDQNGKVSTIPSTTANAGFNVAHGVAPTTPVNGDIWTTTSGLFMRQNGSTKQYVDLDGTQTINGAKTFSNANLTLGNSTAASTYNLGTGATLTATTKAINIGTNGVSGSTTNIAIGSAVSGATSSITLNGVAIASASTTSRPSLRIPHGSAPTTPTNGDLWTETTGIFVRINGASQQLVPFTALSTYAALGSPAFTGTPTAPTATVDTNTTQIATTAYVVGQAGSAAPLVNGTAAVGTSLRYARQDHVHGTDTSRAPLASPALTGTPTAPTATAGTNTTQLATTAFVTAAVPAFATDAQARLGQSKTVAASPYAVTLALSNPSTFQWTTFNSATSGAGAANNNYGQYVYEQDSPNTSVAGYAALYSNTQLSWVNGGSANRLTFTKPVWISGKIAKAGGFAGDANNSYRSYIGATDTGGTPNGGDPVAASVGIKFTGGAGQVFKLMVHNGTTQTLVSGTTTISTDVVYEWMVYSDGAGNATLFINGVQEATTSAGPTGTANTCYAVQAVGQTASAATRMILVNRNIKVVVGN